METSMNKITEALKDRAAKIYETAFWNALGHGMSEDEADTYATKKMNADRPVKLAYRF
jgi:hypothetical protein